MPHRHEIDKESQETVWYRDRGKHKEKLVMTVTVTFLPGVAINHL